MSYADEGAGSPLVLVHGWAGNQHFFKDLSARLAKTHRVLTLTLRAHPGSDQGQAPLTIETLADDIVHFFQALDLKAATALGWSMGAMAVWAAAPTLGARLEAIIVEDMAPRLPNDASWSHGLQPGYSAEDVIATVSEIDADWPAYVSRFAPRMFAPGARAARPEQVDWAIAEMAKAEPHAMASYWRSMAAQDFRGALARITQPMLVIHGGESQVYPDGATAFVANTAPRGERVVIPGAGHVPHLEAADIFFNQVEAFVRTQRRPETKSGGAVP
ncbi:MAG: alpha/beta fold hydrolase [Hyphomonadaceae bacterium]